MWIAHGSKPTEGWLQEVFENKENKSIVDYKRDENEKLIKTEIMKDNDADWEFDEYEEVKHEASNFENVAKETWENSGKLSDYLFYLSEFLKSEGK